MEVFFNGVSYSYGNASNDQIHALKDVNLSVKANQFVAVIGETGSGKSTLIQHLNGLLLPKKGTVHVGGEPLSSHKKKLQKLRKNIGFLFQYPEHQLFEETVTKEIGYGPRMFGLSEHEVNERVSLAMQAVGLPEDLSNRSPFHLSGGQQRRTAIASVLAQEPKMLVLDEPGAGLNPASKDELLQLFLDYQKKKQVTVWMITHSMEDVVKYADYCIVMHKGTVLTADKPENVFTNLELIKNQVIKLPQAMKFANELSKGEEWPFLRNTDELATWIADNYLRKYHE
ncbi:energy-coupling factor transporter ATPase [Shouchella patagoniensis]|uniref:energy-coupling factor transporter ATPase n=1 Tax=Shouchella patagoniensis TaxID=228576 RepID=UPI000995262C|nr:energy-coupling factor transporter ATPase [Shouchella patagoniensis]